jgi:hypothetical protein
MPLTSAQHIDRTTSNERLKKIGLFFDQQLHKRFSLDDKAVSEPADPDDVMSYLNLLNPNENALIATRHDQQYECINVYLPAFRLNFYESMGMIMRKTKQGKQEAILETFGSSKQELGKEDEAELTKIFEAGFQQPA